MNRSGIDIWVGVFVAIGIAAIVFLALRVGNLAAVSHGQTYQLQAKFDNIGGLKARAPVKSAGVVVGRVAQIKFDNTTFEAVVVMNIETAHQFPKDTFGKILTSGLLGEQYVGLDAGGDSASLKEGDTLKKTQGAIVLETLISQFLYSKAQEKPQDSKEMPKAGK